MRFRMRGVAAYCKSFHLKMELSCRFDGCLRAAAALPTGVQPKSASKPRGTAADGGGPGGTITFDAARVAGPGRICFWLLDGWRSVNQSAVFRFYFARGILGAGLNNFYREPHMISATIPGALQSSGNKFIYAVFSYAILSPPQERNG